MSFGSRTRTRSVTSAPMRSVLGGSILGGDDLDGGADVGVRSRWWCDLGGGASASREGRDLALSLSLCASPEIV